MSFKLTQLVGFGGAPAAAGGYAVGQYTAETDEEENFVGYDPFGAFGTFGTEITPIELHEPIDGIAMVDFAKAAELFIVILFTSTPVVSLSTATWLINGVTFTASDVNDYATDGNEVSITFTKMAGFTDTVNFYAELVSV